MEAPYSDSASAAQVGSYFVQQYYQFLQDQPNFVHQFYTDESTVVRVDGDYNESASAVHQIHTLLLSLNFTGIEVKTINSLESWSGGVIVVVSGSVNSKECSGSRNFVQTFFLAPQESGFFVLNDIFHFVSDEGSNQQSVPTLSETKVDFQPTSSPLSEPPVSDNALEVEVREYVNSVHIEGDDPVDEFSVQEQEQEQEQGQQQDPVAETVEKETPVQDSSASNQNAFDSAREPLPTVEESTGEPVKLSYASILRAPKGTYASSLATRLTFSESTPSDSEWHLTTQPIVQQSKYVSSFVPDSGVEIADEGLSQEGEGETKSVYVRNLPTTVSTLDILQEFKNFGKIRSDGVLIRQRKDVGICYAFVDFEDVQSVQNAVKASPILLAGRKVYIEERRANSSNTSRGGRRGRGRGSFAGRAYGRGSNQDVGDKRLRSNGFRG